MTFGASIEPFQALFVTDYPAPPRLATARPAERPSDRATLGPYLNVK